MVQNLRGNIKKSNLILGLLVLTFFIVLVGFIFDSTIYETFTGPDVHQSSTIHIKEQSKKLIFHFADVKTCSQCHTDSIVTECTSCHPNPPMTINENISFPHHDPNGFPQSYNHTMNLTCSLCHDPHDPDPSILNCSSEVCHNGGDDVRYIIVREGNLTYCMQCHEEGSHSMHTTINNRGPELPLYCIDCHDPNDSTRFSDGQNLSNTAICDTCHSPNGIYDGVDDAIIGAKPNWVNGVYNGMLQPGKEQWCVGCHDDQPSVVDGLTAYNVSLFWTSLKGQSGTVDCESCHYTESGMHINSSSSDPNLKGPYVNDTYWTTDPMTELALCFDCHDPDIYINGSAGTNFGSHKKHIANKDIACYACHESHGETGTYHMMRIVPVIGPVTDFIHYPDGGNCQATCHGGSGWKSYSY